MSSIGVGVDVGGGTVGGGEGVAVGGTDGVAVATALGVAVVGGVSVTVGVGVAVRVGVTVSVGCGDAVEVGVALGVRLGDGDAVGDAEWLGAGVFVGVAAGLVGVPVGGATVEVADGGGGPNVSMRSIARSTAGVAPSMRTVTAPMTAGFAGPAHPAAGTNDEKGRSMLMIVNVGSAGTVTDAAEHAVAFEYRVSTTVAPRSLAANIRSPV